MLYKELSYQIIGCCYRVHSAIGAGLLEQCYHNGLYYELKDSGLQVGYNVPFNVEYKGNRVGD